MEPCKPVTITIATHTRNSQTQMASMVQLQTVLLLMAVLRHTLTAMLHQTQSTSIHIMAMAMNCKHNSHRYDQFSADFVAFFHSKISESFFFISLLMFVYLFPSSKRLNSQHRLNRTTQQQPIQLHHLQILCTRANTWLTLAFKILSVCTIYTIDFG